MKPRTAKTTWIIVADGMRARFLLYLPGEKLTPAVERLAQLAQRLRRGGDLQSIEWH